MRRRSPPAMSTILTSAGCGAPSACGCAEPSYGVVTCIALTLQAGWGPAAPGGVQRAYLRQRAPALLTVQRVTVWPDWRARAADTPRHGRRSIFVSRAKAWRLRQ